MANTQTKATHWQLIRMPIGLFFRIATKYNTGFSLDQIRHFFIRSIAKLPSNHARDCPSGTFKFVSTFKPWDMNGTDLDRSWCAFLLPVALVNCPTCKRLIITLWFLDKYSGVVLAWTADLTDIKSERIAKGITTAFCPSVPRLPNIALSWAEVSHLWLMFCPVLFVALIHHHNGLKCYRLFAAVFENESVRQYWVLFQRLFSYS